jgi:glycosyltransferase involved in cell wall biosynthesis
VCKPRVALVSPLWNEEATLEQLAQGVEGQTLPPVAWVLVDDGSTDSTAAVAERISRRLDFASVVTHRVNGPYAADVGSPAAAFNRGLATLDRSSTDYDVVIKIDADVQINPTFVELVGDAFSRDSRLGVAAGEMYVAGRRKIRRDKPGGKHTRGATKAYSREFLGALGGAVPESLGWDTIDEVTAELRGFNVQTVLGAEAVQVRRMGATTGICRGRIRAGRTAHLLGYPIWAIVARSLRRLFEPPVVAGSACLLYGYARARIRREPRAAPPDVVKHIRKSQMQRLRKFGRL